ncbi:MAG TPA: hypothetical protein VN253_22595 [Kofleriaceae bacterium]|nr:hypothetical protein [Kofleriaceae bacterium]
MVTLACACGDNLLTAPPVDPDDVDGDGIPNERDDCPGVRDPVQHDEDGDGFGDACDVCPTVADPQQLDRGEVDALAFEDGVGDACDPRPSRGGDKLAALHTFAVDETRSWRGAGWTIADDRVTASGAARWQHERAEQGDGIAARLAVASVAWRADGASVAVVVDGDGVESGRSCALFADRDADGNDELEVHELGGAVAVQALAGAVTGPLTIIAQRGLERTGTGELRCRIEYGNRTATATIPIDATATGQYAFAAADAEVSATSLIVYTSPVACPTLDRFACSHP